MQKKIVIFILLSLLATTTVLPARGNTNDYYTKLFGKNMGLEPSLSIYQIECNYSGFTFGLPVKVNFGIVKIVPIIWAKSNDNATGKVGHFVAKYEGKTILDKDANEFLYVKGLIFTGDYDLGFINLNGGCIKGKIYGLFEIYADGSLYRFNFPE